jgi:hypothetical protein
MFVFFVKFELGITQFYQENFCERQTFQRINKAISIDIFRRLKFFICEKNSTCLPIADWPKNKVAQN